MIVHVNAGGMMGGESVCGGLGNVSINEKRATCEKCIQICVKYLKDKGYTESQIQAEFPQTKKTNEM